MATMLRPSCQYMIFAIVLKVKNLQKQRHIKNAVRFVQRKISLNILSRKQIRNHKQTDLKNKIKWKYKFVNLVRHFPSMILMIKNLEKN